MFRLKLYQTINYEKILTFQTSIESVVSEINGLALYSTPRNTSVQPSGRPILFGANH